MMRTMNLRAEMPQTLEYPYIDKKYNPEIGLVNFRKTDKHYILQLRVTKIESDNYRLFLNGSCLTLILSEPHEYSRPVHMHNLSWRVYNRQSDEVVKNMEIWLPGDNFYVIRHFAYPENQLLEIVLGNMVSNDIWY